MTEGPVHGVAIVGCGVIAPTHARALRALPNARLVAAVDVHEDRARAFTDQFGGEPFADLDRALARPDVDVVTICVPSGLHAEVGCRAAAAGKHVLVEKPIDVTLEAADRLIDAAARAGVTLGVVSQHRFDPGVRRLHELVASGRLGRLVLGDAIVKWYRSEAYYASAEWRGTRALDGGGALMNQGIHYVDLLRWIMGPVDRVLARCATATHDLEVEDVAAAVLTFAGGALGVLEASTAVYPGMKERLEITGTDGTLVVEAGELRVEQLRDAGGDDPAYGRAVASPAVDARASGAADPAAIGGSAHQAQIADLLEAIDEGRAPAVGGADARDALQLVLAVYASARQGGEVSLHGT